MDTLRSYQSKIPVFNFCIQNQWTEPIYLSNCASGYYINNDLTFGFIVQIKNDKVEIIVNNPAQILFRSGRCGMTELQSNKELKIFFQLQHYHQLNENGNYQIEVIRKMDVFLKRRNNRISKSTLYKYSKKTTLSKSAKLTFNYKKAPS